MRVYRRGLGQVRPVGPEVNEYSRESVWPLPFPREEQLINENKLVTLQPPTIVEQWPTITQPPNIPSSEGEEKRIKREMNTVLWPRTDEGGGPWSLNEPRGYAPNYRSPGVADLGAAEFPFMETGIFGGGLIVAYIGNRYHLPIPMTVGLLAALGGGLALLSRMGR